MSANFQVDPSYLPSAAPDFSLPSSLVPNDLLAIHILQELANLQKSISALEQSIHSQHLATVSSKSAVDPGHPTATNDRDSLSELFPHIQTDILLDIAQHKFKPDDLYKLDSRFLDETSRWHSLESLYIPLQTYFRVLLASASRQDTVQLIANGALAYNAHLFEMQKSHGWDALVPYHLHVHSRRQEEMRNGDYSGWARTDVDLLDRFFNRDRQQTKAVEQSCSACDKGDCVTILTPTGRIHRPRKHPFTDHDERPCKRTRSSVDPPDSCE
ncbi:hypothetical protein AX17_005205 [Amanita inopinata Kibby_2008]|nr:hypothetical protein AX17_005205 [Amanita inopinata Kibby_2008]